MKFASAITALILSSTAVAGGKPPMPPAGGPSSSASAGAVSQSGSTAISAPNINVNVSAGAQAGGSAPGAFAAASAPETAPSTSYTQNNRAFAWGSAAAANTATCHTPILSGIAVWESSICAWKTSCDTLREMGQAKAATECLCQHETARAAMEATGYRCTVSVRFWQGPIAPGRADP